jgi:hypothetical protein
MSFEKPKPVTFRQAKIMNECAPGALVSHGDLSLVIANTARWRDSIGIRIRDVPQRLKWILSARYGYLEPPEIRQLKSGKASQYGQDELGVPGVLFPSWMFCTSCGLMARLPWLAEELKEKPLSERFPMKCGDCGGRMAFVPYVLIHQDGLLDDLPWPYVAHLEARTEEQKNCKHRNRIFLTRNKEGKPVVRCGHCQSETPIIGLLSDTFFAKHRLKGMNAQSWLRDAWIEFGSKPPPVTVDLTDSRIHFPLAVNAIDIPPESRKDPSDLAGRLQALEDFPKIASYREKMPARFRHEVASLARKFNAAIEEIDAIFSEVGQASESAACQSQTDIFKAEYEALITPLSDVHPEERFIPVHLTEEWKQFGANEVTSPCRLVERLVTLERLREVQVFCGFTRVGYEGTPIAPDATGWLPGCELFGEGIFFTLAPEILHKWERQPVVLERIKELDKRLQKSTFRNRANDSMIDPTVSPRFVALHTLSHLIARELEFHCGYPLASIKERVYASSRESGDAAGVLLYVTTTDEYGTLGGLIECSRVEPFSAVLRDALEKAERCSLDPVCAESLGQGADLLNLAACHACCLVPETACQFGNLFLDRQLLVNKQYGLLAFLKRT